MKLDIDILKQYENDKKIISSKHPNLPLIIWNYSRSTAYDKDWDDLTINCRGLITDLEGKVVARSFPKFFNWEEYTDPVIQKAQPIHWNVNPSKLTAFKKEDGSLGIMFYYSGEWIFASRGSFISDQAIFLKEFAKNNFDLSNLSIDLTYIFEIIYPDNRIVLDYKGESRVILLATQVNNAMKEISLSESGKMFSDVATEIPLSGLGKNIDEIFKNLKERDLENEEGYIIKWPDGKRVKIKFENYVRLHWLLSDIDSLKIWECYRDGTMDSIIKEIPDECYDKITEYYKELQQKFRSARLLHQHIRNKVVSDILQYQSIDDYNEHEFNKKYAKRIFNWKEQFTNPNAISTGILFKLRDESVNNSKAVTDLLFKHIKPERIAIL